MLLTMIPGKAICGLNEGGSNGGAETWPGSLYIENVEPTRFSER